MTDSEQVKAALAALAEGETREADDERSVASEGAAASAGGPAYRAVIERAVRATEDIEAAAEFVETVGLERLEAAVRRADHQVSGLADEGREALATFERFRVAAAGPVEG